MPFKGQLLSWELYGDVGLRQSRDLDLAVSLQDLERAQACLEGMGWRLDTSFFPLSPRQWGSFLRHEHHLDFIHSNSGCTLELHWHNQWDTPALTSARWARSIPTIWQGCSFQAMNPIDQALYLCSHGGDHGWFRAKWLGDLARAHAAGKVDWKAALVEARRTSQERALLVGLRLLDKVYGLPLPELSGDPSMNLPPLLIGMSLQALKDPREPATPNSPASFGSRLRMSRYERLLRPGKPWGESLSQLVYCRENFKDIRLPDSFFWAFVPLRPVLWAWRWVRQSSRSIAGNS
jgi:hypothetical protein